MLQQHSEGDRPIMASKPTPPKSGVKPVAAKIPRAAAARPKPVAAADPALATGSEDGEAKAGAKAGLRLKDLVDLVSAATGGKKKGVKEIVEATLGQMGAALQKGESLNLPGFGKVRVARQGNEAGGAMTLKLRPSSGPAAKGKPGKDPIADESDQD